MTTVGRQVLRALAILVALQVATSFVGAWLLGRMSPAVDQILVDNEQSLEAVERMAVALAEAGDAEAGDAARARFAAALRDAEGNVTETGERPELTTLRAHHAAAFAGEPVARERVLRALERLGAINREAMERANEEAQRLGLAGAWVVALLGVLGLAGSVVAVVRTRRRLVAPLRVLADVVTDHARGASHRRCPRTEGGELGEVLGNVNDLLDRLERSKVKASPREELRVEALTHLLDARPSPTWLVDAEGGVVAANQAAFDALAETPTLRGLLDRAVEEDAVEGLRITRWKGGALIEQA